MEILSQAPYISKLEFVLGICKIIGIGRPTERRKLYFFYLVVLGLFIDALKWASQIPYLIENCRNIPVIAATLYIFAPTTACIIKKYSTLRNMGKILKIVDSLSQDIFRPQNVAHQTILEKGARTYFFLYKLFTCAAMGIPLLLCTFPLLDTDEKRLPLRSWFDDKITSSFRYWFFYCYLSIGTFVDGMVAVNTDMLAVGLFIYLGIQCDFLKHTLENLYEIAREKSILSGKTASNEMNVLLRRCIIHHIEILRLKKSVESVYDFSIVLQFGCSIITACTTVFQLSKVQIYSFDFVLLIEFQMALSLQLFLYCWFGDEVTLKAAEIPLAAYRSKWMEGDEAFKKNLIILIQNSQIPLKIYVGGIFPTSLETFLKAFQSAFSYYTVLDNLNM